MSDPMPTVARLRNMAMDEAKRALADCLTAEVAATAALRLLDTAIAAETDAASASSDGDQATADFAAWLRRTLVDRTAAAAALCSAETQSAEARAVLAASRAAARAMDELMARREANRLIAADRTEQAALDETTRYRRD